MDTGEIVSIVLIALIVGGVIAYLIKAKKRGKSCIGCPDSASCSCKGSCNGCNGCGGDKEEK